jgi:hypothetical protein
MGKGAGDRPRRSAMVLRLSSPGSHAGLRLLDEAREGFTSRARSEDDVHGQGGVCGAEVAGACFPEVGAREDDVGRGLQCMAALAVVGVWGSGPVSCVVLPGKSMLREESNCCAKHRSRETGNPNHELRWGARRWVVKGAVCGVTSGVGAPDALPLCEGLRSCDCLEGSDREGNGNGGGFCRCSCLCGNHIKALQRAEVPIARDPTNRDGGKWVVEKDVGDRVADRLARLRVFMPVCGLAPRDNVVVSRENNNGVGGRGI